MKLLHALAFAFLAVVALACPGLPWDPAGQQIPGLVNGTGLHRRWIHHFLYQKKLWYKWPVEKQNGLSRITYCYADEGSRKSLATNLEAAWDMWKTALGGEASRQSGHRLDFFELKTSEGKPRYCYDSGKWDPNMPPETLAIWQSPVSQGSSGSKGQWMYASGGYSPGPLTQGGANHMQLRADAYKEEVAHELGHTFGLDHEHQRYDRDQHIFFQCSALIGYDEVKKLANAEGIEMNELCDFPAQEAFDHIFEQVPQWNGIFQFTEIASYEGVISKEYDLDSIMHYNSFIFAKDGKACYDGDKSKCPITYYTDLTKPETKWKPGDIINYAHKVSKGDADFVKTVYKWGES